MFFQERKNLEASCGLNILEVLRMLEPINEEPLYLKYLKGNLCGEQGTSVNHALGMIPLFAV